MEVMEKEDYPRKAKKIDDSAAVVFDAIQAARATKTDVVIVDTAGRLQLIHRIRQNILLSSPTFHLDLQKDPTL